MTISAMTSILGLTEERALSALRALRLVLYVPEASGIASVLDPPPSQIIRLIVFDLEIYSATGLSIVNA